MVVFDLGGFDDDKIWWVSFVFFLKFIGFVFIGRGGGCFFLNFVMLMCFFVCVYVCVCVGGGGIFQ